MPADQGEAAELAAQIRQYLEAHPAAADTLDGIVSWWLPCPGKAYRAESLEHALELLAAAGVVETIRRSDGHVIYRRAPPEPGRQDPSPDHPEM